MLVLDVPALESFDESTSEFVEFDARQLRLEHNLVAVSKWEAHWHKPLLGGDIPPSELKDYVRCMDTHEHPDPSYYQQLPQNVLRRVGEYMTDPQTATTVNTYGEQPAPGGRVTSELIYYWMIACQIPFEAERWHLNRLLMLIRVCNAKNNPKKMSSAEAGRMQARLNAQRQAMMRSKK